MGKPIEEITHEEWNKIAVYLMRTNDLVASIIRNQILEIKSDVESKPDRWWVRAEIHEVVDAHKDISDMTWLKLGIFIGMECK